MTKQNNPRELIFFEEVAKHNLERFHSECITWAFNKSEKMLVDFIEEVSSNKVVRENIKDAKAYCKIQSVDILLSYKLGSQHYFIHIENKIKANEHFIKVDSDKVDACFKKEIPKKLSQTEYYYVRDKGKIEKELIAGEEAKWEYLFLVPAVCDDTKKNSWNTKIPKAKENPWKTISYWNVIKSMPDFEQDTDDPGIVIFRAYKKYLVSQFLDKGNKDSIQVEIKEDGISTSRINEVLESKNFNTILNAYALRLHFEEVVKHLRDYVKTLTQGFEVRFITDTGNNGGYLLEAFTTAKLENPNTKIFNSIKPIDFRIGFQFEQNQIDKGRFKYYFADVEYKTGLIKTKGKGDYHKALDGKKGILQTIFGEKALKKKCQTKKDDSLKFNGSSSKSFCNYSNNNFIFQDKNELEKIFELELKSLDDILSQNSFKAKLEDKFTQIN